MTAPTCNVLNFKLWGELSVDSVLVERFKTNVFGWDCYSFTLKFIYIYNLTVKCFNT